MRASTCVPVLFAALAVLAVAAAHAAPTSAIVGGLETSLLGGPGSPSAPSTARLERVYSSSANTAKAKGQPGKAPAYKDKTESYASFARTGHRVHLTPAGTPSENPAPCAVGGRHFLHGQQVTRADPCEFCLCLDGEMFCWWQDCPPSSALGPCRGRPAFSSCQDEPTAATAAVVAPDAASASSAASAPLADGATSEQQASMESDGDSAQNDTSTASSAQGVFDADATSASRSQPSQRGQLSQQTTGAVAQDPTTNPQAAQLVSGEQPGTEPAASAVPSMPAAPATGPDSSSSSSLVTAAASPANPTNVTTTSVPTTTELMCHVLGSTYRVGEVLPRDTGSCLQCECSPAGRVTCSPKDCLSVREEEDVYQPASSLDMFDVDSF